MGHQSRLVLLLLLSVGVFHVTHSSTPKPVIDLLHDDLTDNILDLGHDFVNDLEDNSKSHTVNGLKISTPKVKIDSTTAKDLKTSEPATTQQTFSDEILKDLLEASKHSLALAEDPRFNKMLPDRLKLQNATSSKNSSDELEDDYNYDYDEDDYNYDNEESTSTTAATMLKIRSQVPAMRLKFEAEEKAKAKAKAKSEKTEKTDKNVKTNDIDDERDYSDEEIYDDEDDEEDDIADDEEIVFSENVPCARYCECARNINSYLVATCSRLDPGTQKFGSDITDLVVTDVGPKYPILLGPKFFHQLGLKRVASIKIANCTIEYMHQEAFHGLDDLYAVNLTDVGLSIISPDTFVQNKKLRILTISGNDLSVMSSVHYLLKSSSLEELDISRNNLMELNPNAFSQLTNIVYINLAKNNLNKIPANVFDPVETIEELDLSSNMLKELPVGIFNRTALAILHLKYNSFADNFHFGTNDLQQLDLSFNVITNVHHGMFDKMVGLTNLNLKGNGIKKIQADSFLNQKNLRHIDLSINELDQISSMLFYKNSELDVIRLNDNPRLSQLPTDGFRSHNGYFTVYYMDISNCAIGALGHKTFSTMPHLTTLKLAWNNINNLERDTFSSLNKLIDLDLSNNLIQNLDELIFMENNELTKLNLAGNPIRKLSVRLFMPLNKLRELDVSDCELTTLLADKQFGTGYKFFNTLRTFNASTNQIRRISSADIKNFKDLRSLDITHNPLKCNEDFQDFIGYASLHTHALPKKMPTIANLEEAETFIEIQAQASWADLAHEVCKHNQEASKDDKLEKEIEEADKKLEEDTKDLVNIISKNKLQNILKYAQKTDTVKGESVQEPVDEEELNHGGENVDDDEDSDEEYDDEEDDEDDDEETADIVEAKNKFDELNKKRFDELTSKIKEHGIKVEEVKLSDETNDKFLLNKLGDDEDDESDDSDEEIIIERGRIYYSNYNFMIPVIIIVTLVVFILLALVKVVTMVLRKRGERYKMALLASKNSFVYQKLSEDIVKPTAKEPKLPKVHKYAPINQV